MSSPEISHRPIQGSPPTTAIARFCLWNLLNGHRVLPPTLLAALREHGNDVARIFVSLPDGEFEAVVNAARVGWERFATQPGFHEVGTFLSAVGSQRNAPARICLTFPPPRRSRWCQD